MNQTDTIKFCAFLHLGVATARDVKGMGGLVAHMAKKFTPEQARIHNVFMKERQRILDETIAAYEAEEKAKSKPSARP